MIRAVISRDSLGRVVGLKVEGHSGYAPAGRDIVCAAVSAVVQTAIRGVEKVAGCSAIVETGDGVISATFAPGSPDGASGKWSEAQAILEAMVLGLMEIEDGRRRYLSVSQRGEV
ncbi:MAG: ribosomal-processing cysteine protease Prp [Firmicutes bacterium]|jgi:uncharacterized protein YsxB (DUF464 family)|nr:ribosomal-processing cysteine protease Prp [Bacillota bacterium]